MPKIIDDESLKKYPVSSWKVFKNAFREMGDGNLIDGFKGFGVVGGRFIQQAFNFAGGGVGLDFLTNKNLTTKQRALPTALMALTGLIIGSSMALAALTIVIGASMLTPPIMLASSIAGIIRATTSSVTERIERKNLSKELVSHSQIFSSINDKKYKLAPNQKKDLLNFCQLPKQIYNDLYQFRQKIIVDPTLSNKTKQSLVNDINKAIENFSKNGTAALAFSLKSQKFLIKIAEKEQKEIISQFSTLNQKMQVYQETISNINTSNIPTVLMEKIQAYKATQEKIYSQDLPKNIKDEMSELIAKKDGVLHRQSITNLYVKMGNYYLNNSTLKQIDIQDDNRIKAISKYIKNEVELNTIEATYIKPREIYNTLYSLKESMESNQSTNPSHLVAVTQFMIRFKEDPHFYAQLWKSMTSDTSNQLLSKYNSERAQFLSLLADLKDNHQIEKINKLINVYIDNHIACEKIYENAKTLDSKTNDNIDKIKISIENHAKNSLQLYAAQAGQTFHSPDLDPLKEKSNAKLTFSNSEESSMKEIPFLRSVFKKQLGQKEEKFSVDFKNQYQNTFNVLEKAERKRHLDKIAPRRFLQIGLSTAVGVLGLLSSAILPMIASPSAPVAALAMTVIAGIGTGLSIFSFVHNVSLNIQENRSKSKMENQKEQISEVIVPVLKKNKNQNNEMEPTHKSKNDTTLLKRVNKNLNKLSHQLEKLTTLMQKNPKSRRSLLNLSSLHKTEPKPIKKENDKKPENSISSSKPTRQK